MEALSGRESSEKCTLICLAAYRGDETEIVILIRKSLLSTATLLFFRRFNAIGFPVDTRSEITLNMCNLV